MRFLVFKLEPLDHDPDHVVYLERVGSHFSYSPSFEDAFLFSTPKKALYLANKFGGKFKPYV